MSAPPGAGSERAAEGARFVAFGAFNSLATYGIYCVLVAWLHPQLAYALVFALGIALAYWGNSRFVFRAAMRPATALLYPGLYAAQYVFTAGVLHALTAYAELGARLAAAIAIALAVPASYGMNRLLLGRRRGPAA